MGSCRCGLDFIRSLNLIFLFELVTKRNTIEWNSSLFKFKIDGIWRFLNFGDTLEHVNHVFKVNLSLTDFSKHNSHVEKRARQLQEVSLNKHEVAGSHRSRADVMGSHNQIQNHTSGVDNCLSLIELAKWFLNNQILALKTV